MVGDRALRPVDRSRELAHRRRPLVQKPQDRRAERVADCLDLRGPGEGDPIGQLVVGWFAVAGQGAYRLALRNVPNKWIKMLEVPLRHRACPPRSACDRPAARAGARGALLMYSCLPVSEFGTRGRRTSRCRCTGRTATRVDGARRALLSTRAASNPFADSSLPDYGAAAATLLTERVLAFLDE